MKYKPVKITDRAVTSADHTAGSYTLPIGVVTRYDPTGGPLVLEFPESPQPNDTVEIKNATSSATVVTLNQNAVGLHDFEAPLLYDTDTLVTTFQLTEQKSAWRWIFEGSVWLLDKAYQADALKTQDALDVFSFGAYGAAECPQDTAGTIPTLPSWTHLNIFTISSLATPRGITIDTVNSRFSFDYPGIYLFSTNGSVEHNEVNSGREFWLRLFNFTTSTAGDGMIFGTGRNQAVTNVTALFLFEVTPAMVNDQWQMDIGNATGTYSSVNYQVFGYDIFAVSEWRLAPGDFSG